MQDSTIEALFSSITSEKWKYADIPTGTLVDAGLNYGRNKKSQTIDILARSGKKYAYIVYVPGKDVDVKALRKITKMFNEKIGAKKTKCILACSAEPIKSDHFTYYRIGSTASIDSLVNKGKKNKDRGDSYELSVLGALPGLKWIFKSIPDEHYIAAGFGFKEKKKLDTGIDIVVLYNGKYYYIQCKEYLTGSIGISDLGGFASMVASLKSEKAQNLLVYSGKISGNAIDNCKTWATFIEYNRSGTIIPPELSAPKCEKPSEVHEPEAVRTTQFARRRRPTEIERGTREESTDAGVVLAEKDNIIASMKKSLAERDNIIAAMKRDITEREKIIASTNKLLGEKDNVIANMNKGLVERDNFIAGMNRGLVEKDNTIKAGRDRVADMDRELEKRDNIIRELRNNAMRESRPTQGDDRSAEIDELTREVELCRSKCVDANAARAKLTKELDAIRTKNSVKDIECAALRARNNALEESIRDMEGRLTMTEVQPPPRTKISGACFWKVGLSMAVVVIIVEVAIFGIVTVSTQ